jgi:hypothetical protein
MTILLQERIFVNSTLEIKSILIYKIIKIQLILNDV